MVGIYDTHTGAEADITGISGPMVAWIVGALEGAAVVGGLSARGAGVCIVTDFFGHLRFAVVYFG